MPVFSSATVDPSAGMFSLTLPMFKFWLFQIPFECYQASRKPSLYNPLLTVHLPSSFFSITPLAKRTQHSNVSKIHCLLWRSSLPSYYFLLATCTWNSSQLYKVGAVVTVIDENSGGRKRLRNLCS